MPARILAGAMCVQRFDDSLNSAIRITYRISLRSSSMPEPRDPLLKVLIYLFVLHSEISHYNQSLMSPAGAAPGKAPGSRRSNIGMFTGVWELVRLGNDPSAGSPTETLLRLLLPLNDRVWRAFRPWTGSCPPLWASPDASLSHSIGSSDGRCVQRAGT